MMKKPIFVPTYYMTTPNLRKSEMKAPPLTYKVVGGEQEAIYFGYHLIENADIPSFKVYSQEHYAADKKAVYYDGVAVYSLKNNDFKYLGDDYVSYGQKVYYHNEPLTGLDYDSARYIGDFCVVDKNSVFIWGKQVMGAHPSSFKRLAVKTGNGYSKDKAHAYFRVSMIKGADPDTFEVFNNKFARDKNSVYFWGEKIPDLDGAHFIMLSSEEGKDLHSVYHNTQKIEGADAASFKVIDHSYGEDKKAIYSLYTLKPVKHADRETFQALGFGYAKDKRYVYEHGNVVTEADPKTFVLDIPPIQY